MAVSSSANRHQHSYNNYNYSGTGTGIETSVLSRKHVAAAAAAGVILCAACDDDHVQHFDILSKHIRSTTTLCEATASFEMEGADEDWSDLEQPDKETDCELCLGFRQGPCGNYWRRQEMCMDKYKDCDVDDEDTSDEKQASSDNVKDNEDKDEEGVEDKPKLPNWAKPCEKPFVAWNRCLQKHTDWYNDYFEGQKAEAAAEEARMGQGGDNDDDNDDNIDEESLAPKADNGTNKSMPVDNGDPLPDPSDESREAWEKRLQLLEETVTEAMGEATPFPPGDFLKKPSLSINTSAATGMVIFPMSVGGGDIIIGYVRDHNGQLLGVGRRDELDAVKVKGALEFGGINGFTKYVCIYALYEGAEKPMYVHKVNLS